MTKRAIVDLNENRIVSVFERADHLVDLPYVEQEEEVGDNQILGPPEIVLEDDRIVSRRKALRALSGKVAVIEGGKVKEVKNLGPNLIGVKDSVVPYVEVRPDFDSATEMLVGPEEVVADGRVTATWSVADKPLAPPPPTAEEKLASAGLSEAEFDELIAKSLARQGKDGR